MTDDDIRARHVASFDGGDGPAWCDADGDDWPCDTSRETARADLTESLLAQARRDLAVSQDFSNAETSRADAAEEELAEAKDALSLTFQEAQEVMADAHGYLTERDAARALADELAEALNDAAIDAHAYGPVRDHWAGPDGKLGDGPVPLDECQDRFCEAARAALAKWEASRAK